MNEQSKGPAPIPYIAHEAALARMERCNRRAMWLVIILTAAVIGTNAAWFIAMML